MTGTARRRPSGGTRTSSSALFTCAASPLFSRLTTSCGRAGPAPGAGATAAGRLSAPLCAHADAIGAAVRQTAPATQAACSDICMCGSMPRRRPGANRMAFQGPRTFRGRGRFHTIRAEPSPSGHSSERPSRLVQRLRSMPRWVPGLLLMAAAGALLVKSFAGVDARAAALAIVQIGPFAPLMMAPFAVAMTLDAAGMRSLLVALGRQAPFQRLLAIRFATEALHLSVPAGFAVGDSASAALLDTRCDVPLVDGADRRRRAAMARDAGALGIHRARRHARMGVARRGVDEGARRPQSAVDRPRVVAGAAHALGDPRRELPTGRAGRRHPSRQHRARRGPGCASGRRAGAPARRRFNPA